VLLAYLNGAFDRLLAAFSASHEMSDVTKGTVREFGLRAALEYAIPPIARLYSGDIIDCLGNATGQLDFIVAHASTPALGSRDDEPRIVLAEGVLGVIELKSNLATQWRQVERTWAKLCRIRRPLPEAGFDPHGRLFVGRNNAAPAEHAISLMVIGKTGWKDAEELGRRAKALHDAFAKGSELGEKAGSVPAITIAQLDPPSLGIVKPTTFETRMQNGARTGIQNYEITEVTWVDTPGQRGLVLANAWAPLSARARSLMFVPIHWDRYFPPNQLRPPAPKKSSRSAAKRTSTSRQRKGTRKGV
jgi:hypothetical protein